MWRDAIDFKSTHRSLALLVGLGLVVALVPILRAFDGANGALGQSLPLFFLVPVLLASAVGGRWPGIAVSVAAVFVWDWFFINPLYQVTVATARDVLALVIFLAVALLTGQLATIARIQTREALQRARTTEALYALSVDLIARRHLAEVLPRLAQHLQEALDLQACAVLLPSGGGWRTAAVSGDVPADLQVEGNRNAAAIAEWANRTGQSFGYRDGQGTSWETRPVEARSRAQFLPVRAGAQAIGVLELIQKPSVVPGASQEQLLTTFANGVALALEQERLAEEERAAELARESDQLKSALLSSVSHDLRTPLAGIKAAASSLLQDDVHWSEEDRRAFALDIDSEADRLTRLVSNLLDLSRIEAGAISPVKEWEDLGDLIHRVVHRLQPRLDDHPVLLDVPENAPPVQLDAVQIEQVLTNLIENAVKYSLPGTPIRVRADVRDGPAGREALIAVSDEGPGIPVLERDRIFDKFYRLSGAARRAGGTGMGLAIVKGLVDAHGGRVSVENAPGHGSTFIVTLPTDVPPGAAPGARPSTVSGGIA